MKTIGIDSASHKNGIAIFIDGELVDTIAKDFDGKFNLTKLFHMRKWWDKFFTQEKPNLIVIEEVPYVRNSQAISALHQTFSMIVNLADSMGIHVNKMHNRTAKAEIGAKNKEEAIEIMREKHPMLKKASQDECDAVLVVTAYIKKYIEETK